MRVLTMTVLAMSLLFSVLAPAPDSIDEGNRPVLRTKRIEATVSIDGRLEENVWENVPAATGFRQLEPQEGEKPTQETEVRVLYGRDALYVGAMLYDERPGRIRDRLARRDNRNKADWFEVSIDSYLDRQTARTFAVNAAGVQRDGIVRSGSADQRAFNASWDAIWRSAVRITDRGWIAELRIPYDMLRFLEAEKQTWGLQFRRRIPPSEVLEWPLVPRSERQASLVAEYGRLTGLQGLQPDRRVEVSPYVLGRARTQEGLSYGVLGATTGPGFTPKRGYAVGRAEQQIGARSTVGGIVTAFDGPVEDGRTGRRRSLVGGADWDVRFRDGAYRVEGHLTGSHRRTSTGVEASSTGGELTTEFEKLQGDWTYDAGFRVRTPEYNPNDLGRLRRNNQVRVSSFVRHQFNGGQPIGPFQDLSGFFTVNQSWSYDSGLNRGTEPYLEFQGLTDGFRPITLTVDGKNLFGGVDLFETRGLGPRARPTAAISTLRIGTDTRRAWQLTPRVSWTARSDAGWTWSAGLDAQWDISSRLKLSGSLSYEQELGVVEWAANETFVRRGPDAWAIGAESAHPSELATADLRTLDRSTAPLAAALSDVATTELSIDGQPTYYVPIYGGRDTERLNLTLRSNVALTTDLSFGFFGQLFAARGRYEDFRILSDTDDFDAFGAYPRRHDFARSSFIANAALRWEFRPGSELFVVWSQDRRLSRDDPFFRDRQAGTPYDRPTGRRLTDAFRDVPRNAFIVKLRYTLR
jgi:hypothetical protein